MTIDTETTIVTFYREIDGTILAYFPLDNWFKGNNKTSCSIKTSSFSRIADFTACSPDYVKDLPLATKKEYTELKNELENQGYNLKVV